MNLLPILTGQIKARPCVGQWKEKVGLEVLESGERKGRGEEEDGGRGGRRAME